MTQVNCETTLYFPKSLSVWSSANGFCGVPRGVNDTVVLPITKKAMIHVYLLLLFSPSPRPFSLPSFSLEALSISLPSLSQTLIYLPISLSNPYISPHLSQTLIYLPYISQTLISPPHLSQTLISLSPSPSPSPSPFLPPPLPLSHQSCYKGFIHLNKPKSPLRVENM